MEAVLPHEGVDREDVDREDMMKIKKTNAS